MAKETYFYGTGKRKTAMAKVRLLPGGGSITIKVHTLVKIKKF
ncbi:MAG: 30S ribosomal protein S9, partial [Dehalococcoidales bacterium]|nr:30S ribosomal protein S9 [Dehalococcoidales bacterium]